MTPRSLLAPARLAGQPVLRTQSDERLVDLVRAGSDPAFEVIVSRYRGALTRYCGRMLPADRAEDVVQQSFLRAFEAMRASDADLALRPWLYRIAHNTALNALRDRGLRHEALNGQIDGVERPEDVVERGQDLRDVLAAVKELPERQRDAIVLRELEGRSYAEIAAQLGVTGGAVRQLLHRARLRVRDAATAVTPLGLAERLAEATGVAAGGTLAAKVCATALVTGAAIGGVALAPEEHGLGGRAAPPVASGHEPTEPRRGGGPSGLGTASVRAPAPPRPARVSSGSGPGDGGAARGDSRESGSGDDDSRSGSGHRGSNSGPGTGTIEETPRTDNSGPGSESSGSGSSGSSGSGSGESGSSGSGTGGSDADSSGPGSDSSGSGSSGSGSEGSGSDSSGSGSG